MYLRVWRVWVLCGLGVWRSSFLCQSGLATTVCKQITPEDGSGLRPKHVEL